MSRSTNAVYREGPGGFAILVAEDNAINRKLTIQQLAVLGHRADGVTDGREAVEAVRRKAYDLILMDVQMPELDGDMATQAIRGMGDAIQQPYIVALTASAMDDDRARCLAAGMNDYLCKPLVTAELYQVLQKAAPAGYTLAPMPRLAPQAPAPKPPPAESLLDETVIAALLGSFGATPSEALQELAGIYLQGLPPEVDALAAAVATGDPMQVRRAAHRLRGVCMQLGAQQLAAQCGALQRGAMTATAADRALQVEALRTCYQATVREVLNRLTGNY